MGCKRNHENLIALNTLMKFFIPFPQEDETFNIQRVFVFNDPVVLIHSSVISVQGILQLSKRY